MTDYNVTKYCDQLWGKIDTKLPGSKGIMCPPANTIPDSCSFIKEFALQPKIDDGTLSQGTADIISSLCPDVITTCCGETNNINKERVIHMAKVVINQLIINYGDKITEIIKNLKINPYRCSIITNLFNSIVKNPMLLKMIQDMTEINISKYEICDIVQIVSSIGVDLVGIFMDQIGAMLTERNINLDASDYETIISCICPQYTEKKIKCDKVVLLVKNIISEPAFQALVEKKGKGKVIKTTNDICVSLQKIVDDGNDPSEIIYNYLLKMMPPTPDPTPPVYQCDSSNCFTPMICENNTCITPTPPPIDPCEACKNAAPCFSPDGCNNRYTNNGKWAGVYIGCEEKGASACAPSCYPSCIDPIPTPPVSQCDSTNCPPPDSCNNNECIKFIPPPEVDSFDTCNTATKRDKCDNGGKKKFGFRDNCVSPDGCKLRDKNGKWPNTMFKPYGPCNDGAAAGCEACYPPGCGGGNMQMRMRGLNTNYLLYIPTKEKIHEAIMCICPNLKLKPKSESVLNKLNVGLLAAGGSVFTIILYVILFFFVIKLLSTGLKILVFCGLAVATIIIIGLIIHMNPKCLFKSCSGDDWTYIPGTFQGEKTLGSSITIKAQITIDKNKTITLQQLDCAGDKCPFTTLPLACQANNLITLGEKTANGYNILGDCVDSLKNKTVKNITLLQENGNISIMLMVSSGVGDVNVKIPMIKKSVEPYYVYQTERQRNITNDCLPSKDGVY